MFEVKISAYTHKGDIRKTNQDRVFFRYGTINGHFTGIYIVADGCGGLDNGEYASETTVKIFRYFWDSVVGDIITLEDPEDNRINEVLENAIDKANDMCRTYTKETGKTTGTTLSLLFTVDDRFFIRNIGDSRIYKVGLFKAKRLTQDQNLVGDLLRKKEITKKEAKAFKAKNVLTMCIGVYDKAYAYFNNGRIKKGNTFILCSDGLYNCLEERDMMKIIKNNKYKFEHKAQIMRRSIEPGKARDNVSCIIVRYI